MERSTKRIQTSTNIYRSLSAVLIGGILVAIISCQGDHKQQVEDGSTTQNAAQVDEALVATGLPASMQLPFFYDYIPDSSTFRMEENEYYNKEYLNIDTLVKAFNVYYPDVDLIYDKTTADTIFVRIDDAMYLTQQMGSEGASAYISEVVYGLTELPGIKTVNFQFKEGDHAVPGTYDRARISGRVSIR